VAHKRGVNAGRAWRTKHFSKCLCKRIRYPPVASFSATAQVEQLHFLSIVQAEQIALPRERNARAPSSCTLRAGGGGSEVYTYIQEHPS
jgi:hypothetical protein